MPQFSLTRSLVFVVVMLGLTLFAEGMQRRTERFAREHPHLMTPDRIAQAASGRHRRIVRWSLFGMVLAAFLFRLISRLVG